MNEWVFIYKDKKSFHFHLQEHKGKFVKLAISFK